MKKRSEVGNTNHERERAKLDARLAQLHREGAQKIASIPSNAYRGRPPRVRGSATSGDAGDSIAPRAGTIRARVLAFIVANGGSTCDEIEVGLTMSHQTASARISELVLDGHCIRSTTKRKTRSGSNADVITRA